MVRPITALVWKTWLRTMNANTATLVGVILGGVGAASFLPMVALGWFGLGTVDPTWTVAVSSLVWAVLTVVAPLVAVLVQGMNDTLAPDRFAHFPIAVRSLQPGMFLSSWIGIVPVIFGLVGLLYALAWITSPPALLLAAVCIPTGLVTMQLSGLLAVTALADVMRSRKMRDALTLLISLLAVGYAVVVNVIPRVVSSYRFSRDSVVMVADVAAWSPLAWPFTALGAAAQGQWLIAAVRTVGGIGLAVALWLLWGKTYQRMVEGAPVGLSWRRRVAPRQASATQRATKKVARRHGSSPVKAGPPLAKLFGNSPAAAIAQRSLRYMRRDPRQTAQVLVTCLMPVFIAMPLLSSSSKATWLLGLVILGAGLQGVLVTSQISYDGVAMASQICCPVPGRADRRGRFMAFAVLFTPLVIVSTATLVVLTGHDDRVVWMVLFAVGAQWLGVACSLVGGALWQVAVPPTRSSTIANSGSGSWGGAMVTLATMTVGGLLVLPIPVAASLGGRFAWVDWAVLGYAVVGAPIAVWVGTTWGGAILDRTWPEVLQRITYDKAA